MRHTISLRTSGRNLKSKLALWKRLRNVGVPLLALFEYPRTQIVKEKSLNLVGIVGIFPAATVDGEDVEVYANDSR